MIKTDNILATRSRVIYLGGRPHRAGLILSNLLSVPVKTLFRGRSVITNEIDSSVMTNPRSWDRYCYH